MESQNFSYLRLYQRINDFIFDFSQTLPEEQYLIPRKVVRKIKSFWQIEIYYFGHHHRLRPEARKGGNLAEKWIRVPCIVSDCASNLPPHPPYHQRPLSLFSLLSFDDHFHFPACYTDNTDGQEGGWLSNRGVIVGSWVHCNCQLGPTKGTTELPKDHFLSSPITWTNCFFWKRAAHWPYKRNCTPGSPPALRLYPKLTSTNQQWVFEIKTLSHLHQL